jgi:hypothetical protein
LEKYVSWGPDMEALANNAFSFDWSTLDYNIYAFPPFSLIDRILEKIFTNRCWPTGTLSTLQWILEKDDLYVFKILYDFPSLNCTDKKFNKS